ncbi:2-hydroxyacid dehydrogenase [Microbacterium sp. YY-01]|uniref:2-hydroxyacid dehydrogenase n=1 Tax=Microbacterium sp. YY-01 TaxID=3421634 RepID=UPI003D173893
MAYRAAVTRGYAHPDGSTIFGRLPWERLTEAGIEWQVLDEATSPVTASMLQGFDAVMVLGPERIDESSLPVDGRLRHVARFGAGYDAVDVAALQARGIRLTNTPDAVREPMAHTALTLLLALGHNLPAKDRLVREGRWDERGKYRGRGLIGATVGIVGFGGIGQAIAALLQPFGVRVVASNRSDRSAQAATLGVEMLALPGLMQTSDYVVVTVPGGEATRHLIGAAELDALGPHGFLVNIARGSVVDEQALIDRLGDGRLAGAGLDVFEREPLPEGHPLTTLDNVILAPHSLCWTDAFTERVAGSMFDSVIAISRGEEPEHAVV